MKTIDEQIEDAKKLLAYLKEQKANEGQAVTEAVNKPYKIPEYSQLYYYIKDCEVYSRYWDNSALNQGHYLIGNVFLEAEDAMFEVECLKVRHELRKYIYEHGGGNGEYIVGQKNLYIQYSFSNNCICVAMAREDYKCCDIYSQAKAKILWDAIDAIGKDRIKKYYLRVKE